MNMEKAHIAKQTLDEFATFYIPKYGSIRFDLVKNGFEQDCKKPGVFLVANFHHLNGWLPIYFDESAQIEKTLNDSRKLLDVKAKYDSIHILTHLEPMLERRKNKLRALIKLISPPEN